MEYMLTKCENEIANEWQKYQGYTIRPVASTINYYSELISKINDNAKSLIFGSTPEIRSIYQQLNKPLVIVDRCIKMVKAMGLLTHSRNPISVNESVIENDWLMPLQESQQFDVLIGDDSINMVSLNQFPEFLENAYQLLKQDGIFICHLLIKPDENFIKQPFFELVNDYRNGKIKSHFDLASRLNFICYDETNCQMGWQKTIRKLGIDKLSQFYPDFNFIEKFNFCNSHFTCPPQREFEQLVTNYFTIQEIFYPHEHDYCLFEPVYILKKGGEYNE